MWRESKMISEDNIIGDISRNTKIYRFISENRFLDLFKDRSAALVSPSNWDDPLENYILLSPVETSSGVVGEFKLKNDLYGQCWTLDDSSASMWTRYAPKGDAVRIRTTVGKLIDSLFAANEDAASRRCFIGSVTYFTKPKLDQFAQTLFSDGSDPIVYAKAFLVKLKDYREESEVRLIYIDEDQKKYQNGVFIYSLNPRDIVDEVVIDPQMSDGDYRQLRGKIINEIGLDEAIIEHSSLYQTPNYITIPVP